MKEIKFLTRIIKEKKLSLVEQSEEISFSYKEKSESNLISAKILFENSRLEESISLTYYSMYNILLSLLFKVGIKSENHTASIILLKILFNLENKEILNAKKERIDKQYYVDFNVTNNIVEEAIIKAEEFNSFILDFISKLDKGKIENYRKQFKNLLLK